jgi:N-acyl-D-amino-acid deacylase
MTLLIKNVQILGGARSFPGLSDVFVSNDKISAIGNFPNKTADEVIDGQETYLSPGFIDVNTDSDHYLTLFEYPSQEDFLRQGVTTIFGGTCGSSLAPLLYGGLESFQKWGDTNRVNVNWHTMREFLAVMDKRPLGVNFGTLVGHGTIRRALVGDALRDLTKNELAVFARILRTALAEGGFGLSFGLGYVHERKTPYSELKALANIVKEMHGVCALHLRNTAEGIVEATEEAIKLAADAGAKAIVNHFVPHVGTEKKYETALKTIEALPPDMNFRFDLYPSSRLLLPLYTFLPAWVQTGGVDAMLTNLKEEWLLSKMKKDMPRLNEEEFVIARAPGNDFLVGKSLVDVKHMYGLKDGRDALLRLMLTMSLKGGVLYKNLNERLIEETIPSPRSFIASNAPSFEFNPERGERGKQIKSERTTSTFTKFLKLVFDRHIMPLEAAIRKITLEPARMFGLAGRGEIKEGNIADLTCFHNDEILYTVVNGRVVIKNGVFQNTFPGRALRHRVRAAS